MNTLVNITQEELEKKITTRYSNKPQPQYKNARERNTQRIDSIQVDEETRIEHIHNHALGDGFMLRIKIDKTWYYQWLLLGCRGGGLEYLENLRVHATALYEYLKKNDLFLYGTPSLEDVL